MARKRTQEIEGEMFAAGKGGREGETPATEEPDSEGLRHGAGKPEDASSGMAWKRAKEMEGEMFAAGKGGR
ncbi:unnamed protein product, partial [Anisakis simplex]|uniref:Uncharacterized protein n=1 Tax=Anisakis simplex TaxID=6269 RepID=A0A0M3KKS2_ANISI